MSAVDQFIIITATNERTARFFLERSNDVLNDAVASFFELGADVIPDEYRPDLLAAAPILPPKSSDSTPVLSVPVFENKEVVIPTIQCVDPDLLKEVPKMVLIEPEKIEDLKIELNQESSVVIQKQLNRYSYSINGACDDESEEFTAAKLTGKIGSRSNEYEYLDFVLWKDGYSINDHFVAQSEKEYQKTLGIIQKGGFPTEKTNKFADFNLIDNRNHNYAKASNLPANFM
jgi:hypothetical protein